MSAVASREPLEWDDVNAEFRRSAEDASLPPPLREAFSALQAHHEKFNEWISELSERGEEGRLQDAWGAAAEREEEAALAVRDYRAAAVDAKAVLDAVAACRAQYVKLMTAGTK